MGLFFLGYQLFIAPQKNAPQVPSAEIFADLKKDNQLIHDVDAAAAYGKYDTSLSNEVKTAEEALKKDPKLSDAARKTQLDALEADKEHKLLEARMLVADSQYKGAIVKREIQRVIFAFDPLQALERKIGNTPLWNEKFKVAYDPKFKGDGRDVPTFTDEKGGKWVEISPATLKQEARATASDLGKNTPVWGFFPGYELIDFLVGVSGRFPGFSYALACFLLALFVRAVVFPISKKQMIWGRQMAQLSPLAQEIKDQYKSKDGKPIPMEKQNEMNQRVMGLYQEYGMNPMAGCLPAFMQLPLFLMIYQSMQHYRFEFEKGTFLWINEGIGKSTNGFLAANLGQKDYALIVLYGITMLVSTWLQPVSDPTNARQSRMMGMAMAIMFSVMMFFWQVPSAFVLYWVFTNILATSQSLWVYRLPLQPLQKKNTPTGGRFPGIMNQFGQQPNASNGHIKTEDVKTGVPQQHKPKKKKK